MIVMTDSDLFQMKLYNPLSQELCIYFLQGRIYVQWLNSVYSRVITAFSLICLTLSVKVGLGKAIQGQRFSF